MVRFVVVVVVIVGLRWSAGEVVTLSREAKVLSRNEKMVGTLSQSIKIVTQSRELKVLSRNEKMVMNCLNQSRRVKL